MCGTLSRAGLAECSPWVASCGLRSDLVGSPSPHVLLLGTWGRIPMQVSIRSCNWPWITCKETQFVCASGLYVRERDLAVQQGQLPWLCSQPGPSPESLWQQRACCLRSVLSECQVVSTRLMWSKLGKVSSLRPLGNSLRVNQGQPPCGPFWGQVSGMCWAEAHRTHLAKGNPSVAVWREVPCWKAALVMGGEQASPSCPHGPVSPWDSDIT